MTKGWRKNSTRYYSEGSKVETKIRSKGWQWKRDVGKQYDTFLKHLVGLPDFPASAASIIQRDSRTKDTEQAHKALNELILDCFKKVWKTED